jgi:flagellar FliL protein
MAKPDEKEPEAAKPKSKLKLIIIALVAVLVLAGGLFAGRYFFASRRSVRAAEETKDARVARDGRTAGEGHDDDKAAHGNESGIINFEPFLVNLADQDGFRYLRVTMRVAVTSRMKADQIGSTDTVVSKMRDVILNILATKTSNEIITSPGKQKLKAEIKESLNSFLPEKPVMDIYFTDFVVQL